LEITLYTKSDLIQKAGEFFPPFSTQIPITRQRLISLIRNPIAEDSDVLFIAAVIDNEWAGYISLIPEIAHTKNESIKMAWLSAWYVNPKYSKDSVASIIFLRAYGLYNRKVAAAGYSEQAAGLYENSSFFFELTKKTGFDYIFKTEKSAQKPFRNLITSCLNSIIVTRQKSKLNSFPVGKFSVEVFNQIDTNMEAWIQNNDRNFVFRKNQKALEWILKNPWVLQGLESKDIKNRYYFSSSEKQFFYLPCCVYDEKEIISIFVLRCRDEYFTIPYYICNNHHQAMAQVLLKILTAYKAKTFTCFYQELNDEIEKLYWPCYKKKLVDRRFYFSKSLKKFDFSTRKIHDGEGDLIFT